MTNIVFTPPVDAPGLSLAQVQSAEGIYHGDDGGFFLSFKGHVYPIARNHPEDTADDTLGDEVTDGSIRFTLVPSNFTIIGP